MSYLAYKEKKTRTKTLQSVATAQKVVKKLSQVHVIIRYERISMKIYARIEDGPNGILLKISIIWSIIQDSSLFVYER